MRELVLKFGCKLACPRQIGLNLNSCHPHTLHVLQGTTVTLSDPDRYCGHTLEFRATTISSTRMESDLASWPVLVQAGPCCDKAIGDVEADSSKCCSGASDGSVCVCAPDGQAVAGAALCCSGYLNGNGQCGKLADILPISTMCASPSVPRV